MKARAVTKGVLAFAGLAAVAAVAFWLTRDAAGSRGSPTLTTTAGIDVSGPARADLATPSPAEPPRSDPAVPEPTLEPAAAELEVVPVPETELGQIVFGRLTTTDDSPPGEAWIEFTDSDGLRTVVRSGTGGRYSVAGLAPGEWRFSARGLRTHGTTGRFSLAREDPPRRLDVTLRPQVVIAVRVTTPDGRPYRQVAADAPLVALASLEEPGPWFEWGFHSDQGPRGAGSFWEAGYYCDADAPDVIGCLVLDEDPPLFASVLSYDQVLATERVEPGDEEVRFVLSPDEVCRSYGSIAVQFVDATSGEPLQAGNLFVMRGAGLRTPKIGVDGWYRLEDQPPGKYVLSPSITGYEALDREVRLDPGAHLDLGAWPLAPARKVELTVVDSGGEPLALSFHAGVLGADRRAFRVDRFRSYGIYGGRGDGPLSIGGLSAARYVLLSAWSDEDLPAWTTQPIEVDLSSASSVELTVVAAPTVVLSLQPSAGLSPEGCRLELFAEDGLRLLGTPITANQGRRVPLPAGRYELWTQHPGTAVRKEWITLQQDLTLEVGP